MDLAVERLEACGSPAKLNAPSQNVRARGARMEYNVPAKSMILEGGREVFLQQGPNEIHARRVEYRASEDGRLGRALSQGPGWLRGQFDGPASSWRPLEGPIADHSSRAGSRGFLNGRRNAKAQTAGELEAKEVFFWLAEPPSSVNGRRPPPYLRRMMCPWRRTHQLAATDRRGRAVGGVVSNRGLSGRRYRSPASAQGTHQANERPIGSDDVAGHR